MGNQLVGATTSVFGSRFVPQCKNRMLEGNVKDIASRGLNGNMVSVNMEGKGKDSLF